MAWYFRRRVKIAPGIHLNFSKSGVSTSIGPKGAKMTFGKDGTYLYTGIPGSGLYSRSKLSAGDASSGPNASINIGSNETSANGCLFGLTIVFICIGIILLSSGPINNPDKIAAIFLVFILASVFFIVLLSDIKRRRKEDSLVASLTNISRYDYFIDRYNTIEGIILKNANQAIANAQVQLQLTSDTIKKSFLQSYIDHYKYDYLSRLLSFCKFNAEDMVEELDPLVVKASEKIVTLRKCGSRELWEWFGYDLTIDRTNLILNQLCECGIIDRGFEESQYTILVRNLRQVNSIFKKAKGRSLLSIEEKQKLNTFFELRYNELIGGHELIGTLSQDEAITALYLDVIQAYNTLVSSKSIWEILDSRASTEAKSYASTIVDRKDIFSMHAKSFNFLNPCKDTGAPYFEFKQGGICFYIYPKFIIAARSETDFDVINFEDIRLEFEKSHFVVTNSSSIPKDAKLVKYTYKYINKNGERDARYADNPRYPVYEYGDITIYPYRKTLEFSNSESTKTFFEKMQMLMHGGMDFVDSNFGTTERFFNKVLEVAKPLCDFYDKLLRSRKILNTIDRAFPNNIGGNKEILRSFFLSDMLKCFSQLGHDISNLLTLEGLPLFIVEAHAISDVTITYDRIQMKSIRDIAYSLEETNMSINTTYLQEKTEGYFYLNELFNVCGADDFKTKYFSLLYRFFSIVAKADDKISTTEAKWLEKLISFSSSCNKHGIETREKETNVEGRNLDINGTISFDETNPIEELQALIGLEEVKKEVSALANFVKIQQQRDKKGMKAVGISYHCVFIGNPGTGKTTVARILAAVYRDLGILKKGHLVETDRSGLVAEYVGQTAVKTNKIIDSALDGVLFIDEAYSLLQNGVNDYGTEAIATLLKRMEDDRNRLIVVLAGYSDEMKIFIDSNPGLQSRFNRYIHFSDYSVDELKQIFMLNVAKYQYRLEEDGKKLLGQILQFAVNHKDKNFGNGRYVRNLFEKTIQNQATRLSSQPSITTEELSRLKAEDLPSQTIPLQ